MIFAQAPPTEHPPPVAQLACLGVILLGIVVFACGAFWLIFKLISRK